MEPGGEVTIVDAMASYVRWFEHDRPPVIANEHDLDMKILSLMTMDEISRRFAYPDSETIIVGVWQANVEIFALDFPIAGHCGVKPGQSRYCISPDVTDNLCVWACLALFMGARRDRCQRKAIQLWESFYGGAFFKDEYPGVLMSDLRSIEVKLKVNLFVYAEDRTLLFRSALTFPAEHSVYLCVQNTNMVGVLHCALITQPDLFLRRLPCPECGRFFKTPKALANHEERTNCMLREIFPEHPDVYTPPENAMKIFLRKWRKPLSLDYKIKYLIAFDYESILQKMPLDGSMEDDGGPTLMFTTKHIPCSVVIHSNVPGFDRSYFICERDPLVLNQNYYLKQIEATVRTLEMARLQIDTELFEGRQLKEFDRLFMVPVVDQ